MEISNAMRSVAFPDLMISGAVLFNKLPSSLIRAKEIYMVVDQRS